MIGRTFYPPGWNYYVKPRPPKVNASRITKNYLKKTSAQASTLTRPTHNATTATSTAENMTRHTNPDQTFVALVDTYLDRVYRYLRNLTRDADLARDFAHETFLKLRKQVAAGQVISEAYVFTTARNTALSHWRSDKREGDKRAAWGRERDPVGQSSGQSGAPMDHSNPASLAVENQELGQALETALGCLSEDQRTVFLLSEVEGMKYEKIAEVLDISAGTVASRKFNAVRALRGELERLGHALP